MQLQPDEAWATVWADDAYWNLMGMEVNGKEAIVGMWKGAMGGLEAVSFHCVPCMIAVDGDNPARRGAKNGPRIATGAEGAIDVSAAVARFELRQDFAQHDRHMRHFMIGVQASHRRGKPG